MKGRNSVVISIRVSDSVNTMLKELATRRGVTVSAYVKAKVEDFVSRVNPSVNTMPDTNLGDRVVNTITDNHFRPVPKPHR